MSYEGYLIPCRTALHLFSTIYHLLKTLPSIVQGQHAPKQKSTASSEPTASHFPSGSLLDPNSFKNTALFYQHLQDLSEISYPTPLCGESVHHDHILVSAVHIFACVLHKVVEEVGPGRVRGVLEIREVILVCLQPHGLCHSL